MKNDWTADGETLNEKITITSTLTHQDNRPGKRMQRLNAVDAEDKHVIRIVTTQEAQETLNFTDEQTLHVTLDGNDFLAGSMSLQAAVGGQAPQSVPGEAQTVSGQELENVFESAVQTLSARIYAQLGRRRARRSAEIFHSERCILMQTRRYNMSLKKRMLAFVLSAAVALCPALSLAEGISSYYAGEMTGISVSRSYTSGQQIDMSMTFDLELEGGLNSARAKALDSLLEKSRLDVSLYDDAGTAHVHAAFLTDGVKLLDVNALIYQDGSVQAMTNLTGKTVLALPAGTFSMEGISFESLLYGEMMPQEEGEDGSAQASAFERLRSTASDVGVMIFSHLLGWVSYTQRDTGRTLCV